MKNIILNEKYQNSLKNRYSIVVEFLNNNNLTFEASQPTKTEVIIKVKKIALVLNYGIETGEKTWGKTSIFNSDLSVLNKDLHYLNINEVIEFLKTLVTENQEVKDISEKQVEKYSGVDLLTDESLKAYFTFKPLHYIFKSLNINDDDFKKINKLINIIESSIKVGDMYLYSIQQQILKSIKHGEHDKTIKNVNNKYNTNINSIEVYDSIVNKFKYSYGL